MNLVFQILYGLVALFWYLLVARIAVEMIRSFAREWRPRGALVVALESVFTVTDPPVLALRRAIRPVRIGNVALDLSVILLFIAVMIVKWILGSLIV